MGIGLGLTNAASLTAGNRKALQQNWHDHKLPTALDAPGKSESAH
jgi:CO/xanthine dehydrogenase Mo-binding subunit